MCGMACSGSTLAAHQTSPASWLTSESPRAGSRQVFSVMAQVLLKCTGTEDHNRQSPGGGNIVASMKEGRGLCAVSRNHCRLSALPGSWGYLPAPLLLLLSSALKAHLLCPIEQQQYDKSRRRECLGERQWKRAQCVGS